MNEDRVAICGDWHGNHDFARIVLDRLAKENINIVLHCGDFGIWREDDNYVAFMQKAAKRNNQLIMVAPGNHENYDLIEALETPWIRDRIYLCPRGESASFGKTKFVFIGGGHSVDKANRTPHLSWWPQELLTYGDIQRTIEQHAKCDVIISHDCPISVHLDFLDGYKTDETSMGNRNLLQHAVDALLPKYLFHGHYHQFYEGTDRNGTKTIGLGGDKYGAGKLDENYLIFNTITQEVE
jgi:Icc-related predicted phosphoesterase